MILNLKLDLDFLNEGFELGPFNGLRKKDLSDNDKIECSSYFVTPKFASKARDDSPVLLVTQFL